MKERDKLKEICNLIGHESNLLDDYLDMGFHSDRYIDVREIIFTQEFMEKFIKHTLGHYENLLEKQFDEIHILANLCRKHLDNPVEYLYNLLELGKKQ